MRKVYNGLLLASLSFLVTIVAFTSCKKNSDDVSSGITELLSFGPTGAKHGDTLRFIGNNLDKVTSIEFTGVNAIVDQSSFSKQTDKLILLLVPQAAEKGYVTLKTPQGDIVSKTQLNLGVSASVTSMTYEARPGENITITGTYLNWVRSITFSDDKLVDNFVSQTFDQIVVTIPEDAKTGPLIIDYTGTDSASFETSDTVHVTLPKVVSFAPNPVHHQTNVTITGTDLDLVKKVYFTNVANAVTSFVSQSATELVVNVPAATKKGPVTLEAASEVQTVSIAYLDVVLPTITSFGPNPVDPLADLTINGTNLDLVTSVTLENVQAITSFVSQTPTQLVVTVPTGTANGLITLGVLNSTVTVQSSDILEITGTAPPPTIALHFYDDAVTSNWNGWIGGGWGGVADYNNGSPVRVGTKSIKIDYSGGWGAPLQLGGANISLSSYTTFKLSLYGGPGSAGNKVNVVFNGSGGYQITLGTEGEWNDYAIPLSALTSGSTLSEIWLQEFSGVGGYTLYVDEIGLN